MGSCNGGTLSQTPVNHGKRRPGWRCFDLDDLHGHIYAFLLVRVLNIASLEIWLLLPHANGHMLRTRIVPL